MPEKTIHYCTKCDYKSTRRWDRDRHMRSQHKLYNNNNIAVNETKIIQEAIKINDAPNHEPLHNIQYGSGSVVTSSAHIPIEKYNDAVEIGHSWKNNCEKLDKM